jgi:mono/diheme cytochrome c family protein
LSAGVRLVGSGLFAIATVVAAIAWSGDDRGSSSPPAVAASTDLVANGRAIFTAKGCVVCHERFQVGPDLRGLRARAGARVEGLDAEAYVRQSVREPQAFFAGSTSGAVMPTLEVSDAELDALVAYLLSR